MDEIHLPLSRIHTYSTYLLLTRPFYEAFSNVFASGTEIEEVRESSRVVSRPRITDNVVLQ